MAVTDWKFPNAETGQFTNPTNMYASDDVDATCPNTYAHTFSDFRFDGAGGLPANATPTGFEWRVEGAAGSKSTTKVAGDLYVTAKGIGPSYTDTFTPGADQTLSVGGDGLLMGWAGGDPTAAELRASTFQIALTIENQTGTAAFLGDAVSIRIYYTVPTAEVRVTGLEADLVFTKKTALVTAMGALLLMSLKTGCITALDSEVTYSEFYVPPQAPPEETSAVLEFVGDESEPWEWVAQPSMSGIDSYQHITDDPYNADVRWLQPNVSYPPTGAPVESWLLVTLPSECETLTRLTLRVNMSSTDNVGAFTFFADDDEVAVADWATPDGIINIGGPKPYVYVWQFTGLDVSGDSVFRLRLQLDEWVGDVTKPEIEALRIWGTYDVKITPHPSEKRLHVYVAPSALKAHVAPSTLRVHVAPSKLRGHN